MVFWEINKDELAQLNLFHEEKNVTRDKKDLLVASLLPQFRKWYMCYYKIRQIGLSVFRTQLNINYEGF